MSFKEYIFEKGTYNLPQKFRDYLEIGSFSRNKKYHVGMYNTIVKNLAENLKVRDIGRLERLLKSDGVKINVRTVESYLKAFCDSHILYKADRYDVKGKKLLKTLSKYYMVDVGLRYLLLGDRQIDTGRMLENIVYLELLRRNRKVYVGKVFEKEIDFVAEGN